MTRNQDVAALLYEIAQILEVQGVAFKPRAYQRAALNIENLGEDIEAVMRQGRLAEIPGVGAAIAEKVSEYLITGRLAYLEKLRKELPPGVVTMMSLTGIGPKTALRLHKELKIQDLAGLEAAAAAGKIRELKGFGKKTEQEILDALKRRKTDPGRTPYPTALEVADEILAVLRASPAVLRAEAAGSLRRGRDTVGDLDVLATARPGQGTKAVEAFLAFREREQTLEQGATRARMRLRSGVQVDLRVVAEESFGAALLYFTGSKEHNIRLRTLALKKGWTINEYALASKRTKKPLAGRTEEEIYAKLGLDFVPPELREAQDEIALAAARRLPALVGLGDLQGDLHTHTQESDGRATAQEMVDAARRLGRRWLGISDHAKGMGIVNGLDASRFARQRQALRRLEERLDGFRVFQGAEVDIRKDGTLALDRAARESLDYVIMSVHSAFTLAPAEQTKRVLRALEAGVDIFGHPFARRFPDRRPIELDWEKVVDRAVELGILLEINASPDRLDLSGERVRAAREHGAAFVIDSDAHTTAGLQVLPFGVTQARRGGLEAKHVVTALPAREAEKRFGRAKRR